MPTISNTSPWLLFMIIGVAIFLCAAYQFFTYQGQARPRAPLSLYDVKWGLPVDDPESAIGAGWFVEVEGRRVAELTEPRMQPETPHWLSYVVVPLTDDSTMKQQLLTSEFWHSGRAAFRSKKFGVLAKSVLVSGVPPCSETHRIIARSFRVEGLITRNK